MACLHHMTPTEYATALTTLKLSPEQAATWLGIGRSTAYRYLKTGCEGPVVVAIRMAVAVMTATVHEVEMVWDGDWVCEPVVRHSDLTAAVGLPKAWKAGDKLTWCDESFVFSHYDPAYPRAMCVSDVDGRTVAINITTAQQK